jgi:hypothetical protein
MAIGLARSLRDFAADSTSRCKDALEQQCVQFARPWQCRLELCRKAAEIPFPPWFDAAPDSFMGTPLRCAAVRAGGNRGHPFQRPCRTLVPAIRLALQGESKRRASGHPGNCPNRGHGLTNAQARGCRSGLMATKSAATRRARYPMPAEIARIPTRRKLMDAYQARPAYQRNDLSRLDQPRRAARDAAEATRPDVGGACRWSWLHEDALARRASRREAVAAQACLLTTSCGGREPGLEAFGALPRGGRASYVACSLL